MMKTSPTVLCNTLSLPGFKCCECGLWTRQEWAPVHRRSLPVRLRHREHEHRGLFGFFATAWEHHTVPSNTRLFLGTPKVIWGCDNPLRVSWDRLVQRGNRRGEGVK